MSSNLDSVLKRNAREVEQEAEVQRIMKAFKLNPYDVLDLPFPCTEADVKKRFRKISLLIHPDKFKHEQGSDAFDMAKKAEAQLSETPRRAEIDAIMNHARKLVLTSVLGQGFSTAVEDSDPRLQNLKPPLESQIRAKAKEVLVEDELGRRRKQQVMFANEGAEKAKAEEELSRRKRKVEDAKLWEERREDRVQGWRQFQKQPKTKKKKNEHVLG